jgi:hypothetical protein
VNRSAIWARYSCKEREQADYYYYKQTVRQREMMTYMRAFVTRAELRREPASCWTLLANSTSVLILYVVGTCRLQNRFLDRLTSSTISPFQIKILMIIETFYPIEKV